MPNNSQHNRIYVCQSGTCRSKGSDAALVEIEELANLVGDCQVETTGCFGYVSQGPAVLTTTRKKKQRHQNKNLIHFKVNTFEKSADVVKVVTGKEDKVVMGDLPIESQQRLSEMRDIKKREYLIATYQWNKALAGITKELLQNQTRYSDIKTILNKAGYPNLSPHDVLQPSSNGYLPNHLLPPMPTACIDNYVLWNVESVEIVSKHSAIFKLVTNDLKRGTPHPRGRGKMAEPVTWHVTLLGEVGRNEEGPLPWIERDYTPISSALEWERGRCDILIKVYGDGCLTS